MTEDGAAARASSRWAPVALRAGYGAMLLIAPERLLGTGSPRVPGWAAPVVRVLGARHLLQAAVLAARPTLACAGAFIDAAHASSDVACAGLRRDLRTPALVDAGIAAVLAASWHVPSPS